jgi:phosphopantetheinyl transferase
MCSISDAPHGCDIESTEPRDSSFIDESFGEAETKLLKRSIKELPITEDVAVTLFFSAKEALLKMKGIGLAENIRSVQVKKAVRTDDHLSMELTLEHAKKKFGVRTRMFGAYIISTCRGN